MPARARKSVDSTDSADAAPAMEGSHPGSYTIASLAATAGVNVETVRYYQRRGLMSQPPRPLGGIRRYSEADVGQLAFIRRAQQIGFNLAEIERLLNLRGPRSCRSTRDLVSAKLTALDARIRDLRYVRRDLARWLADCDANKANLSCPVIERLKLGSVRCNDLN